MKNFVVFILCILFTGISIATDTSTARLPKINYIFNYMLSSDPELDEIFDSLAIELAQLNGDENLLTELLRRDTGEDDLSAIRALAVYLRQSEYSRILYENINLATSKIPEELLSDRELEAAAAKTIVAIIGAQASLDYIAPILKKYEDYIELFNSKRIAKNKALSFFCLHIINPFIFESGAISDNVNLIKIAAYIQKQSNLNPLFACVKPGSTYKQILDTLGLLNKKFDRNFTFSKEFNTDFFKSLSKLSSKIKSGIIEVKEKTIIDWLEKKYDLPKLSAIELLDRLLIQKIILIKESKYMPGSISKKYPLKPKNSYKLNS